MTQTLKTPKINAELIGLEHDVEYLYKDRPIEKYQERLANLNEALEYTKAFAIGNGKFGRRSIVDLETRIDRLKNIIHDKSHNNGESKKV